MGFWEMGNYIETPESPRVVALKTAQAVAHQRADDARVCECLAAWDDERECICDKQVAIPLSIERLKRASRLADEIGRIESQINQIGKGKHADLFCHAYPLKDPASHCWSDHDHFLCLSLPKAMVLACLRNQKMKLLEELQGTGVISVDRSNIRAVPK